MKYGHRLTCLLCFARFHSHVDPSEHYLAWAKPPVNVLVIKKAMDSHVTRRFMQVTRWLVEVRTPRGGGGVRVDDVDPVSTTVLRARRA